VEQNPNKKDADGELQEKMSSGQKQHKFSQDRTTLLENCAVSAQ
jgi:hypothetical protein